jgi:hypothetical protein
VACALLFLMVFGAWQSLQAYSQRVRADAKEGEIARLMEFLNTRMQEWPPAQGAEPASRSYLPLEERTRDVRQMNRIVTEDFSNLLSLRPGRTERRDALVQQAVRYFAQAEQRSAKDTVLKREVGRGFLSVAKLQSRPVDNREAPGLGDSTGAISNYRSSGILLLDLAGSGVQDAELQTDLQSIQTQLVALGAAPLPSAPVTTITPPAAPPPPPTLPPVTRTSSATAATAAPPRNPPPAVTTTATATTPPAPVPAPPATQQAAPAAAAELVEGAQRYGLVASQGVSAESLLESHRRDLARRGLAVRAELVQNADQMRRNLQLAKTELDRGDASAAKTYLDRADYYGKQVLKALGR